MSASEGHKPPGRLTSARRRMLDRLLDQLLDQPPEQRPGLLAECRRRAPRMGAWLTRLAQASSGPGGILDDSARSMFEEALEARFQQTGNPLGPDTRLGPWRVVEQVGVGGMGEVYRAERADGTFDMQVAVKLIRSQSDDLAALLTSERQTLARLNHPGIARLLDGGITDDGRPYLVMDWVGGPTLDQWCFERSPSLDQRLRAFGEICEAVAAAHRELIVHGDIKPSNIKVAENGRTCLLDFGVARLLDREGQHDLPMALTPGFAAPEVLEGRPVSTAADIHGLGALLHWLVHGYPPGRGEAPASGLQGRGLRRQRDLAAIIERATHVDPQMRYATVDALALDVRRIGLDLPVRARRAGLLERVGLWARRHSVGAVLGVVAVVLLVGGVAAVVWQARLASAERDLAQAEAARSNALREHLTLLFREVGSLADDAEQMTARELLDRTAEVAGEWLADDPDLRQQVNAVLGEVMIALNDYAAAESLLAEFAEGEGAISSPLLHSIALQDLAQVHHRRGRIAEGLELADRAVALLDSLAGAHPARTSDLLQVRGRLLRDSGRWEEAVADLRRARELALDVSAGPRPLMARAESNLGTTLLIGGQLEAAARHYEAAEALWIALGRPDSSDSLVSLGNLASVLERLGRDEEAEQRLRRVIELRREKYGDSGAMAAARLALGRLLVVKGQFDEAGRQIELAERIFARFIGEDTPDFGAAQLGLGELAEARGELDRARGRYAHAHRIMTERLGERHPYSVHTALALLRVDRRLEADFDPDRYGQLVELAESGGGAMRSVRSAIACDQAQFELDRARLETARAHAQVCLELRENLGLGGWRLEEARALIAAARERAGEPEAGLARHVDRLIQTTHSEHPLVLWLQSGRAAGT